MIPSGRKARYGCNGLVNRSQQLTFRLIWPRARPKFCRAKGANPGRTMQDRETRTFFHAMLDDRGVVCVRGMEAKAFLQGLITNDVLTLGPGEGRYAALLTPQGKIIVDFLVTDAPAENGSLLYLDCPRSLASDLVKRLVNLQVARQDRRLEDASERLHFASAQPGARGCGCLATRNRRHSRPSSSDPSTLREALGRRFMAVPADVETADGRRTSRPRSMRLPSNRARCPERRRRLRLSAKPSA